MAAVLVSYSPQEVLRAIRSVAETFRVEDTTTDKLAQRLVAISGQAHRKGLMALENELHRHRRSISRRVASGS